MTKSILLASAAGLMAVSAQAADLPGEPVPAAVDYVKVCDTFGAGFFYIPGTETCLDISGRVRFTVRYSDPADTIRWNADGRVDFDARNMTEYGQLRSFFRISGGRTAVNGGADTDADGQVDVLLGDDDYAGIDLAFIQLGYLTVGKHGDVANGDILYGIDSFGYWTGDSDLVGVTVLADDLGGGFYVGAGVYTRQWAMSGLLYDGNDFNAELQGAVGMTGQSWGGFDLSAAYGTGPLHNGGVDYWSIKATADLVLAEGFNARLVAAYYDTDGANTDVITLSGAASYAVSDAATIYAGLRYDIDDGDDFIGANIGVDYTIVDGLIGTGEISYFDEGAVDGFSVIGRLTRNW